jgi:hypothetical protein
MLFHSGSAKSADATMRRKHLLEMHLQKQAARR